MNFCILNALTQVVSESTRGANILNLTLVSNLGLVDHVSVLEPLFSSDHFRAALSLRVHAADEPRGFCGYNFARGNYDAIGSALSFVKWEYKFSFFPSVDDKLLLLNGWLNNLVAKYVPQSRPRNRVVFLPRALRWIGRRI